MWNKIQYALIYSWVKVHALLPMWALYILSDILYVLIYKVVRYRVKVVRQNMKASFPDKSDTELRRLEREFYHHFADYVVETIKLAHISLEELQRRAFLKNPELVDTLMEKGHTCFILLMGHYGNWEWVSSMPLHLWRGAHPCQIYHHLHNRTAAYIFEKLRTRFGATNIPMEDTLTVIGHDWRDGVPNICGYIADQSPKYASLHHFVQFFGRETAVLTGTERISRLVHAPVYYCEMTRPRRGRYVCRFIKMTDDASALPKFALTDDYWRRLEAQIRREPHLWLWSHRRWKHTAVRFRELYPDDWPRRLSRL